LADIHFGLALLSPQYSSGTQAAQGVVGERTGHRQSQPEEMNE
jgi:hypothetical protein